jgi:hypothetical protein
MTPGELQARLTRTEQALGEFSLAVAAAARLYTRVTGEQVVARIAELAEREEILIELCHLVTEALQKNPPLIQEALEALETVRLWSFPLPPPDA